MAEPCRENCPRSWATVLAIALTLAACGATTEIDAAADASPEALPEPLPGGLVVTLSVDVERAVAHVDPRFLSVAVDTSQVVGGHWWSESDTTGMVGQQLATPFDFTRPRLARLASALAPALLRIGGSEADVVAYDLSDTPPEQAAEPFELLFTKAQWAGIDAPDLLSATVLLNGVELAAAADGSLPPLVAETLPRADGAAWVRLPPTSVAFVRVPAAEAPACGR